MSDKIITEPLKTDEADSSARMLHNKFIEAVIAGDLETVRSLITRVDPADADQAALQAAVWRGHTEVVKLLLADPRVDPADCGRTLLHDAVCLGRLDAVELLLADPRVDPAAENQRALRVAITEHYPEIVELLLADPRVDPAAENQRALRLAMWHDRPQITKLLLADPRVNLADVGDEYFRNMVESGSTELAEVLSEHMAKITSPVVSDQGKARH